MKPKKDLEQFILDVAERRGNFQQHDQDLLHGPELDEFVDAGFGLLGHYQRTSDTEIRESVVGALVSCAALLGLLSEDQTLSPAERQRADQTCTALEDLLNAMTKAIENNM